MLRCVVLGTCTCASNALYSTHRSQVAPVLSAPAVRVPSLSLASVASDWPVSPPFCLPRRRKLPFSLTPAHALPVVFYSWYVKMSMWIDFTLCSTPRYLPRLVHQGGWQREEWATVGTLGGWASPQGLLFAPDNLTLPTVCRRKHRRVVCLLMDAWLIRGPAWSLVHA